MGKERMSTEDSLQELFEALEELRKEWGECRCSDELVRSVRRIVEAYEAYGLSTAKQLVDGYELVRPDLDESLP